MIAPLSLLFPFSSRASSVDAPRNESEKIIQGAFFWEETDLELGVEMKFISKEDVERMKKEIASEESVSTRNPTFDKNVSMESVIAKKTFVIANKAK